MTSVRMDILYKMEHVYHVVLAVNFVLKMNVLNVILDFIRT